MAPNLVPGPPQRSTAVISLSVRIPETLGSLRKQFGGRILSQRAEEKIAIASFLKNLLEDGVQGLVCLLPGCGLEQIVNSLGSTELFQAGPLREAGVNLGEQPSC